MDFAALQTQVIEGNFRGAETLTRAALQGGIAPLAIVHEALVPAMDVVGERFKTQEYFLPDMMIAAKAMKAAMALLKPLLSQSQPAMQGKVVIGTVKGDLHDIGKNIVVMMLEGAGFEIVDLGVDVPPDRFRQAVRDHRPPLLGLSALLTTTMPAMKTTIDALEEAGLRSTVKIVVGGAPVSERYAERIGADAYGADAVAAVEQARRLIAGPATR